MAIFEELSPKKYSELYEASASEREGIKRRQDYYEGKHDIVNSGRETVHGSPKSEIVTNFIRYGVDMYTGSIVGEPILVSGIERDDSEGDNESPQLYRDIATLNNFDISDVTNARNAYIAGYGMETYEYDGGTGDIVITAQNPAYWHNVFNSDGGHIGSIYSSKIDKGKFYDGEMLDHGLTIMIVYSDTSIRYFTKKSKDKNQDWVEDTDKSTTHEFGRVPVVLWRINENYSSIIGDDLIGQQDEYNKIDSISGDDLEYDSDGVLEVKGYNISQIAELSSDIRKYKIFPAPTDGGIRFVKKDTDSARVESRLNRTRKNIFMALGVPDVDEITGSTGDTSGIALGLKFKPMQDNAKSMIANLRASIRDRIDMLNSILSKTKNAIDDVQINIEFDLPTNRVEQWQNISSLEGTVSHKTRLELLEDVSDPEEELKRITREAENNRLIARSDGTPDEIVARNDAEIKDLAVQFQPTIANLISAASDAVLAETIKQAPKAKPSE